MYFFFNFKSCYITSPVETGTTLCYQTLEYVAAKGLIMHVVIRSLRDGYVLIPRTLEYVSLHGKRKLVDVTNDHGRGDYLGSSVGPM